MSITHTFTNSWVSSQSGSQPLSSQVKVTADGEDNRDVPVGATDTVDIAWTCTVADLKGFYLLATAAMTVSFITAGSPIVFDLIAGQPVSWNALSQLINPLTADVLSVQAVGGAADGNLSLRALSATS